MSNTKSGARRREDAPPSVPLEGVLPQAGEHDSLATVFAMLASQRRQYVLYYLHQRGDIAVEELAELIAASENSGDRATVTADEQEAVLIELIHSHLPQMVAADIVAYDKRTHRVRLGAESPHLSRHLNEATVVDFP